MFSWLEKLGGWLFSWGVAHQQRQQHIEDARTLRRREVREELVKFHQLIHDTNRGVWPAGTADAWAPLQRQVLEHKEKVQHLLDIDRKTPGVDWCTDVEDCLEKGWKLLHNCYGQSILSGPRVSKLHDEMPARRDEYYAAYKNVTDE